MTIETNTSELAYVHNLKASSRPALENGWNGSLNGCIFTWESSDPSIATIDSTGRLIRNLAVDTGTVTVTFKGWAFDSNPNTPISQRSNRPVLGTKTFTLVPLAALLPPINVEITV